MHMNECYIYVTPTTFCKAIVFNSIEVLSENIKLFPVKELEQVASDIVRTYNVEQITLIGADLYTYKLRQNLEGNENMKNVKILARERMNFD